MSITVFYDGKCGLCAKEINHYKQLAPAGIFQWIDINDNIEALEQRNLSLKEVLMSLHTEDLQGNLHQGIDSFILIWRHLPGWKLLSDIISLPLINGLSRKLYTLFTHWRFNRLAHCQISL